MVAAMPGVEELVRPPDDPDAFDAFHPGNVSPVIAWLAESDCPATSQVFQVIGSKLFVFEMSHIEHELDAGERWTAERLAAPFCSPAKQSSIFLHEGSTLPPWHSRIGRRGKSLTPSGGHWTGNGPRRVSA